MATRKLIVRPFLSWPANAGHPDDTSAMRADSWMAGSPGSSPRASNPAMVSVYVVSVHNGH
jgi:hypothetical protein